jgi:5-methylcytosine-specific restriction endonuclease McrA
MPRRPNVKRKYIPKNRRSKRNRVNKVHRTNRWTKLSVRYRQDNPSCEVHKHYGIIEPATETDHIYRIADGGAPYDTNNLMSICNDCHNIKTAIENKGNLNLDFDLNENKERIPTNKEQIYKLFKKIFAQ